MQPRTQLPTHQPRRQATQSVSSHSHPAQCIGQAFALVRSFVDARVHAIRGQSEDVSNTNSTSRSPRFHGLLLHRQRCKHQTSGRFNARTNHYCSVRPSILATLIAHSKLLNCTTYSSRKHAQHDLAHYFTYDADGAIPRRKLRWSEHHTRSSCVHECSMTTSNMR